MSATPRDRRRRERERRIRDNLGTLARRTRVLSEILERRHPGEAQAARHLAELAAETADLVS